jgi:Ca-activated chloride channel family protein
MASEGFETYDVEPASIPDVFAERPVVVFGKWRGDPAGTLRVTGTGGSGAYEQRLDVAEYEAAAENRALRYLWARARVARLSDYGWRRDEENRLEVTTLGLTYELLTAYTSFIAVHEVVRNRTADGQDVDQPLPLPAGVSDLAVGSAVPEPGLIVLLVLCLVTVLLARYRRSALCHAAPRSRR